MAVRAGWCGKKNGSEPIERHGPHVTLNQTNITTILTASEKARISGVTLTIEKDKNVPPPSAKIDASGASSVSDISVQDGSATLTASNQSTIDGVSVGSVKTREATPMSETTTQKVPSWFPAAAFVVGVAFMLLAFLHPGSDPTTHRAVLAMGCAGFATALTGFLSINLSLGKGVALVAGGSLAVFVVVYFLNPGSGSVQPGTVTPNGISPSGPAAAVERGHGEPAVPGSDLAGSASGPAGARSPSDVRSATTPSATSTPPAAVFNVEAKGKNAQAFGQVNGTVSVTHARDDAQ
jgi:hypothetical protein